MLSLNRGFMQVPLENQEIVAHQDLRASLVTEECREILEG